MTKPFYETLKPTTRNNAPDTQSVNPLLQVRVNSDRKHHGDQALFSAVYQKINTLAQQKVKPAQEFMRAFSSKKKGSVDEMRQSESALVAAIMKTHFAGGNKPNDIETAIYQAIEAAITFKIESNPKLFQKAETHVEAAIAETGSAMQVG